MPKQELARITVVGNIVYQATGKRLVVVPLRYDRQTESREQAYERGPIPHPLEWTPLDTGWIPNVGLLTLQCGSASPSPLLISFMPEFLGDSEEELIPHCQILPGECLPLVPARRIRVFAKGVEDGTMILTALPR